MRTTTDPARRVPPFGGSSSAPLRRGGVGLVSAACTAAMTATVLLMATDVSVPGSLGLGALMGLLCLLLVVVG